MSNRFTGWVKSRMRLDGWIDPREHDALKARIKELEVQVAELINQRNQLQAQLHQRDTALVAAREALQVFVSGATKIDLKQTHKAIAQIDHALSQIQEVKP